MIKHRRKPLESHDHEQRSEDYFWNTSTSLKKISGYTSFLRCVGGEKCLHQKEIEILEYRYTAGRLKRTMEFCKDWVSGKPASVLPTLISCNPKFPCNTGSLPPPPILHTPILFLAISLLSGSQLNSCLSPAIFIHFPFDYAFTSPNRIMLYYRKQSSSMSLYYIAQSTFLERRNPSLFIVQAQLVSQLLQKPPFNLPALPAEKKRITFLIVSNFSVSMRRQ